MWEELSASGIISWASLTKFPTLWAKFPELSFHGIYHNFQPYVWVIIDKYMLPVKAIKVHEGGDHVSLAIKNSQF